MPFDTATPPKSVTFARLLLLVFFIGGVFTLPQFIFHLLEDDCINSSNLEHFDDVNEDECAQITGVQFGPKDEYVTVEVKTDNLAPVMIDFQNTIKDAILTYFDIQLIVMADTIPNEIVEFNKSIDDLEVTARRLAQGDSFSQQEVQAQLDKIQTDFDNLTTKYKSQQRLVMLETSKIID